MKPSNKKILRIIALLFFALAYSNMMFSCSDSQLAENEKAMKKEIQTDTLLKISKGAAEKFIKKDGNPIVKGTVFGDRFMIEATQVITTLDSSQAYAFVLKSLKDQEMAKERISFVLYDYNEKKVYWKAIVPIADSAAKIKKNEYFYGKVILSPDFVSAADDKDLEYISIAFYKRWPAKKDDALEMITAGKFKGRDKYLAPFK
jgi:hypothetical protein